MKDAGGNRWRSSDNRPPQDRAEFVRRLAIALLLVVALLVVWRLLDLLLLIFGAVLVAVLLRAISDPLARGTGLPAGWSIAVTVLGLLALVVLIGWLFGAQIRSQVEGLSTTLPQAWRSLRRLGSQDGPAWPAGRNRISSAPQRRLIADQLSPGAIQSAFDRNLAARRWLSERAESGGRHGDGCKPHGPQIR